MKLSYAALAFGAALAIGMPAAAQETSTFRPPSGNSRR
jgi:hypothetical protein